MSAEMMEDVHAFQKELSTLYQAKLPVSRAKMGNITRLAIKATRMYKHVVQAVEKFIAKCAQDYKVPGLYVMDSIVRQSRYQLAQKDPFAPRFSKNICLTFRNLYKCPENDRAKVTRVLNLWQKNAVLPKEIVNILMDIAAKPTNLEVFEKAQQQCDKITGGGTRPVKAKKGKPAEPALPAASAEPEQPLPADPLQESAGFNVQEPQLQHTEAPPKGSGRKRRSRWEAVPDPAVPDPQPVAAVLGSDVAMAINSEEPAGTATNADMAELQHIQRVHKQIMETGDMSLLDSNLLDSLTVASNRLKPPATGGVGPPGGSAGAGQGKVAGRGSVKKSLLDFDYGDTDEEEEGELVEEEAPSAGGIAGLDQQALMERVRTLVSSFANKSQQQPADEPDDAPAVYRPPHQKSGIPPVPQPVGPPPGANSAVLPPPFNASVPPPPFGGMGVPPPPMPGAGHAPPAAPGGVSGGKDRDYRQDQDYRADQGARQGGPPGFPRDAYNRDQQAPVHDFGMRGQPGVNPMASLGPSGEGGQGDEDFRMDRDLRADSDMRIDRDFRSGRDGGEDHYRGRDGRDRDRDGRGRDRDRDRRGRRSYSRERDRGDRKRRRSRSRSTERGGHRERDRESDREEERRRRDEEKRRRHAGLPPFRPKHVIVCSLTLWLGHVNKTTREHELKEALEEYGPVKSIHMIPPRGCAYVVMCQRAHASRVVDRLARNRMIITGNHIKINWGTPRCLTENKELKKWWDTESGAAYVPWETVPMDIVRVAEEGGAFVDPDSLSDDLKKAATPEPPVPLPPSPMHLPPGLPTPFPPALPGGPMGAPLGLRPPLPPSGVPPPLPTSGGMMPSTQPPLPAMVARPPLPPMPPGHPFSAPSPAGPSPFAGVMSLGPGVPPPVGPPPGALLGAGAVRAPNLMPPPGGAPPTAPLTLGGPPMGMPGSMRPPPGAPGQQIPAGALVPGAGRPVLGMPPQGVPPPVLAQMGAQRLGQPMAGALHHLAPAVSMQQASMQQASMQQASMQQASMQQAVAAATMQQALHHHHQQQQQAALAVAVGMGALSVPRPMPPAGPPALPLMRPPGVGEELQARAPSPHRHPGPPAQPSKLSPLARQRSSSPIRHQGQGDGSLQRQLSQRRSSERENRQDGTGGDPQQSPAGGPVADTDKTKEGREDRAGSPVTRGSADYYQGGDPEDVADKEGPSHGEFDRFRGPSHDDDDDDDYTPDNRGGPPRGGGPAPPMHERPGPVRDLPPHRHPSAVLFPHGPRGHPLSGGPVGMPPRFREGMGGPGGILPPPRPGFEGPANTMEPSNGPGIRSGTPGGGRAGGQSRWSTEDLGPEEAEISAAASGLVDGGGPLPSSNLISVVSGEGAQENAPEDDYADEMGDIERAAEIEDIEGAVAMEDIEQAVQMEQVPAQISSEHQGGPPGDELLSAQPADTRGDHFVEVQEAAPMEGSPVGPEVDGEVDGVSGAAGSDGPAGVEEPDQ